MLLKIPVYHKVRAREKGRRTVYLHDVYSMAEFEIASVPEENAPVALSYPDSSYGHETELRYHEGRFWRPEKSNGQVLDPEAWADLLPEIGKYTEVKQRDPDGWADYVKSQGRWQSFRRFTTDAYRDVTKRDFDDRLAELKTFLDRNVRIIAGGVWIEVPEPRYFMTKSHKKITANIVFKQPTGKRQVHYGKPLPVDGEFFRIDRHDDMVAHGAENYDGHESDLGPEATILIHGIYEFRDEEMSLQAKCDTICAGLKAWLGDFDRSVGIAWFNLRDAALEAKDSRDQDAYEHLAQCLSALTEAIAATRDHDRHAYQQAAAEANPALSRWQMRSMDFPVGFGI